MTLEEKGTNKIEVTWIFSEEEIAKIKSHEEAGTNCELTKRFENGTWELSFDSRGADRGYMAVWLRAVPQTEDYKQSSSKRTWCRKGSVKYRLRLIPSWVHDSNPTTRLDEAVFDSNDPIEGELLSRKFASLLAERDIAGSLGIHVIMETPQAVIPSPPASALFRFFDNPTYADTLFRIYGIEAEAPWPIFACKEMLIASSSHFTTLFQSGFSESTSQELIDTDKIERPVYSLAYRATEYELLPFKPLYAALEPPTKCQADLKELNGAEGGSGSNEERARKRRRGNDDSGIPELGKAGKSLTVIDIHETTYVTFRAMLAYLHTGLVPFSALPSDFLVLHDQARAAEGKEGTPETETFHFADWQGEAFDGLAGQRDWEGVSCCTPHSMYRLADRYEMDELREMSLGFILRSLTVENVAYELFSPLSLDYEVIQKPILEFFIKNWKEVKKTTGFKSVLDKFSLGELAKGRDLMETIFGLIGA